MCQCQERAWGRDGYVDVCGVRRAAAPQHSRPPPKSSPGRRRRPRRRRAASAQGGCAPARLASPDQHASRVSYLYNRMLQHIVALYARTGDLLATGNSLTTHFMHALWAFCAILREPGSRGTVREN